MRKTLLACAAVAALATTCEPPVVIPEAAPTTPSPSPSPSGRTAGVPSPRFTGEIRTIDVVTRNRMTASRRGGCPVPLSDLRLLRLSHWGFDAKPHIGELVVHADVAVGVRDAFETLFTARFPIQRMRLVDVYGADDARSMAANNTSAFNCRRSTGDPRSWSEHAYGRAVDINPIQNPYVSSNGEVEPAAGRPYLSRPAGARGLITADGVVVHAFRAIGWVWGGTWERSKDYQHFSRSGR